MNIATLHVEGEVQAPHEVAFRGDGKSAERETARAWCKQFTVADWRQEAYDAFDKDGDGRSRKPHFCDT